jgi:hypothetical protein
VKADDLYLDPVTGRFDLQQAGLMAYCLGHNYGLGKKIGKFGWSVQKEEKEAITKGWIHNPTHQQTYRSCLSIYQKISQRLRY